MMAALPAIIGIACALFLANVLITRWQRKLRAHMARHVEREAIRQAQQLHPHERGEVPAAERVDKQLAWRIAKRGR